MEFEFLFIRFVVLFLLCDFDLDLFGYCRWYGNGGVESSEESILLQAWGLCSWVEGEFNSRSFQLLYLILDIDF